MAEPVESVSPTNPIDAPIRVAHRVGANWIEGPSTTPDVNPARPDEVVATAPLGDPAIARAALAAARRALPAWARTPAPVRGAILERAGLLLLDRAESIGRELVREEGKTLAEAVGEVRRAGAVLRYHGARGLDSDGELYPSASPTTRIWTIRQPVGVVALVTPWNFPIAIPAWKVGPALVYGNTVVLKPATATPLCAFRLVEALVDAGVPDGVVNLVFAPGSVIETEWCSAAGVDALSFTGSAAVGHRVRDRATAHGIKVQLELGGKNGVVVANDGDLDLAATLIVRGAFASAGQKCTATARVIAVEEVAGALLERLAQRLDALVVGDPLEASTTLGPLIDDDAARRVGAMVQAAVASGARVARQGQVPGVGAYSSPVILDHVDPAARIAREEIFGPVLALMTATDLDQAIAIHNDVPQGLSGAIFTRDLGAAHRFAMAAGVGIVHINGETAGAEPHVPFGGMKDSSSGSREQGLDAATFYTQRKTIYWDGLPEAGLFDTESS